MAQQGEVIVLSPHLDDAALDCADHILAWKKLGLSVRVVTLFAKSTSPSPESVTFDPSTDLERRRIHEDREVMSRLGVSWNHLSFADGRSRQENGKPHRESEQLQRGTSKDPIVAALTKAIVPFQKGSLFVAPLGIGGHVDHLLVREAAEFETDPADLCYYVDYPYALSVLNWTCTNMLRVMRAKKSIKVMSRAKRQLLGIYSSQIPQIFSHTRFSMPWITWNLVRVYPEIVVYGKRTRLGTQK